MKNGDLAKSAGVNIGTVRYYERNGILPPPARQSSGYGGYGDEDISSLRIVRGAKAPGFTLMEIPELLVLSSRRDEDVAWRKASATEKLANVEEKLKETTRARYDLRALGTSCPGHGALVRCPILAALREANG